MAGVSAPTCDTPPTMRYWRWRPGGDVRYSHDSSDPDEDSNVAARGHRWQRLLSISIPIAFVQLIACIPLGDAVAQICTVSSSSVTLGSGSCSISPNTTLNGSPAVHATTNAQITTNNVTVNPNNGGSTGGLAETNGTIIFSAGSSINGNWATAASAQTGGQIIFRSGSAINPAFGGGGTALIANGSGGGQASQIIATGLSVNMNGGGGNVAAKAIGGGIITLNTGTTINFAPGGGGNTGLWATGAGSQIVTTGTNLTMTGGGGGDTGVRADGGANVMLSGGAVRVQSNGGGETGLMASGAGSSINASGLTVDVSNSGGGRGAFLQNGAAIALTNGSVTTSGPGTFGFLFQAPTGIANTLTLNGTNVSSAADAFAVQGGTANIATTDATVIGNNGTLLSATQGAGAPAAVTMTATSSNLTGAILTDAVSTSTVTLDSATIWRMTGNSNVTNLNNNGNSLINFTAPTGDPTQLASYKTLTAVNYVGAGGRILLNTYLGGDGSPSDRLIINGGTATGTTGLIIRNTTGPGGGTTGNGILVVSAINNGTTAPGAFALAGEIRRGARDYDLFRGGLNGTDPNDWFLRSTMDVPPGTGEPPIGTDPPPGTLPPGFWPIIGPELATYGVVQSIARQIGLQTLGTLHQRIGDTLTLASADGERAGLARSEWARVFGDRIDNRYQAFADPRARLDGRLSRRR